MTKHTVEVFDPDLGQWWLNARFAACGDAWTWAEQLRSSGCLVRLTRRQGKHQSSVELHPAEAV